MKFGWPSKGRAVVTRRFLSPNAIVKLYHIAVIVMLTVIAAAYLLVKTGPSSLAGRRVMSEMAAAETT
jgi:hypothetical protein